MDIPLLRSRRSRVATRIATTLAFVVLVTLMSPVDSHAQSRVPELWLRAVSVAERNNAWVPVSIVMADSWRDSNEGVLESRSLRYVIDWSVSELRWELVSAVINGVDRTQWATSGGEIDRYLYPDESSWEQVFDRATQPRITAITDIGTVKFGDRECRSFAFVLTTTDGIWEGEAAIETATGVPVELRISNSAGYREDRDRYSNIEGTIRYRAAETAWYPTTILYEMDVESRSFPFFTFRGTAAVSIRLSDYLRIEGQVQ